MKKEIKIICTLGPSSLNREFLKFAKNKISLLRLNMSHLNLSNLKKSIKFIRKYTATNLLESMVEHNYPTKGEANNNL